MANYLENCPHFLDSDELVFHKDIFTKSAKVIDRGLGLQHKMQPQATALLESLSKTTRYSHLRQLAAQQSVPLNQIHELLGFFASSGSLVRHRDCRQQLIAMLQISRDSLYGVRHHFLFKRLPTSSFNLTRAICIAGILPIVCGASLIITWQLLGMNATLISTSWYVFGAFWLSVLAHELGHYVTLARHSTHNVILYGPLKVSIIHTPLTRQEDIFVALMGPLLGLGSCAAFSMAALLFRADVAAFVCMWLCVVHVGSLLPWYGDGKSVWCSREESP